MEELMEYFLQEGDMAKKTVIPRHLIKKERKSTFESDFLPDLSNFSALNFTQSYQFSYFTMPEHVKSFNKEVRRGALRLPEIPIHEKPVPEMKNPIGPRLKKSKRAKKLERLEDPILLI